MSTLSLFLPARHPIPAGDAFAIRPGCDKTFTTCEARCDTAVDFRGFAPRPRQRPGAPLPRSQS